MDTDEAEGCTCRCQGRRAPVLSSLADTLTDVRARSPKNPPLVPEGVKASIRERPRHDMGGVPDRFELCAARLSGGISTSIEGSSHRTTYRRAHHRSRVSRSPPSAVVGAGSCARSPASPALPKIRSEVADDARGSSCGRAVCGVRQCAAVCRWSDWPTSVGQCQGQGEGSRGGEGG
jgi:hypothetical protein